MQKGDDLDPKGLIFEAYRIDGISGPECRTIFLDWALSIPGTTVPADLITALLQRYEGAYPDHPMTETLKEGLERIGQPRRRGGWRSRPRDA
ncbi:hypothetical protein [Tateyamaria sp. ANG-S1]|uniref:hypothetical protein n=1 Tax=Tateyamaria sp. ANG-S1 TaxID=1577905 RepID=UPI0005807C7F|nr:hypothetical protein [Tateyamaria sp. ANG-S1]KIC49276.1 hypothetical protein RA29_15265 [Tateyamaria sp. ANG-S1]